MSCPYEYYRKRHPPTDAATGPAATHAHTYGLPAPAFLHAVPPELPKILYFHTNILIVAAPLQSIPYRWVFRKCSGFTCESPHVHRAPRSSWGQPNIRWSTVSILVLPHAFLGTHRPPCPQEPERPTDRPGVRVLRDRFLALVTDRVIHRIVLRSSVLGFLECHSIPFTTHTPTPSL